MKYKIILSISLALSLSFSCKKLSDINQNPNQAEYINPNYLFTYSILSGMGSYNNEVNLHQRSLMRWMMYFAVRGGVEQNKVYESPSGQSGFWQENYSAALNNTQEVIKLCSNDKQKVNQYAIARIWKAYLFYRISDMWGEIPYSEALKGYSELNKMPAYDSQEFIYKDLLKELKEASQALDAGKESFGKADLIFEGDVDKWQRFANSLRLKLALRVKYASPELYQEQMGEIVSLPLIASESQSAIFMYNTEKKSPVYEADERGESTEQNNPSKFLVDRMVKTKDPRISMYLKKSPDSNLPWVPDYKGVPNLVPPTSDIWKNYSNTWSDISGLSKWFLRNKFPQPLLSYSELCFLKAEAALDGYFGSPLQYLKEGVKAHMNYLNAYAPTGFATMKDTDINKYIDAISKAYLEDIITEKWLSFAFTNAYEAWADYRRTSFPVLKDYDNQAIDESALPCRLLYPMSEINLNGQHYSQAIARQGPDQQSTKIWWDKN